jgi:hypothetical protein
MAFLLDIGTVLTGCYFLFSILLLVLSRLIECRVHRANNVFREIKKQKYMVYIFNPIPQRSIDLNNVYAMKLCIINDGICSIAENILNRV